MRKSADQDLALGQNNLGLMYQEGRGVPQDIGEAAAWFRKAAAQGDKLAEKNLAVLRKARTMLYLWIAFVVVMVCGFVVLLFVITSIFSMRDTNAGALASQ
jgi:hypothetical protein